MREVAYLIQLLGFDEIIYTILTARFALAVFFHFFG